MIDLTVAPTPPGPRFPVWVTRGIVIAASLTLFVVLYALPDYSLGNPSELFLVLIAVLVAVALVTYARLRFVTDGYWTTGTLWGRGFDAGDVENDRRPADPQEREAWGRFRRGTTTRWEYERVAARRRFAHGELSAEEYREAVAELDDDERTHARVVLRTSSPPDGPDR